MSHQLRKLQKTRNFCGKTYYCISSLILSQFTFTMFQSTKEVMVCPRFSPVSHNSPLSSTCSFSQLASTFFNFFNDKIAKLCSSLIVPGNPINSPQFPPQ